MNGCDDTSIIPNADHRLPCTPTDILSFFRKQMHAKDPEMSPHGERTARFAVALGAAIGLCENALIDLY